MEKRNKREDTPKDDRTRSTAAAGSTAAPLAAHTWTRAGEAVRFFILSPPFQCAVQFAAAIVLAELFVVVRPMTFTRACLAPVLLSSALAILSADNHIGTRLQAAANMTGGLLWGSALAGVVLTLANLAAPSSCTSFVGCPQHTVALGCLGVAALGLLVAARSAVRGPYPPLIGVAGLLGVIGYGITVISGQFMMDVRLIWTEAVGSMMLVSVIGPGASALVSLAVIPSLAVDEMRADTAAAIRAIGHAAGRIASQIFEPDAPRRTQDASSQDVQSASCGSEACSKAAPVVNGFRVFVNGDVGGQAPAGAGPVILEPAGSVLQPLPQLRPLALLRRALRRRRLSEPDNDLETISEVQSLKLGLDENALRQQLQQALQPQAQAPHSTQGGPPPEKLSDQRLASVAQPVVAVVGPSAAADRPVLGRPMPLAVALQAVSSSDGARGDVGQAAATSRPEWVDVALTDLRPIMQAVRSVAPSVDASTDAQTYGGGQVSSRPCVECPPCPPAATAKATLTHDDTDPDAGSCTGGPRARALGRVVTFHLGPMAAPRASQQGDPPAALDSPNTRRLPGVVSCPTLEILDSPDTAHQNNNGPAASAGTQATTAYTPNAEDAWSVYSSEDEWGTRSPHQGRSGARERNRLIRSMEYDAGDGDFDEVFEDETAFLAMLQELTAPQSAPPGLGGGGGRRGSFRRAPAAVAPPGGILPSPSTSQLLHGATSRLGAALPTSTPKDRSSKRQSTLQDGSQPQAAVAAAGGVGGGTGSAAVAAAAEAIPGAGPATAHGGGGLSGAAVTWAPVSAIRPLLARARACAAAAAVEPPWMMRGPADLGSWSRVLAGCEVLMNRMSALECLLEDARQGQAGPLFEESKLSALLGTNIIVPYRQVYGDVAARCAAMSAALTDCIEGRGSVRSKAFVAVDDWQASKARLQSIVQEALATYWARVWGWGHEAKEGPHSAGPTGDLTAAPRWPSQQSLLLQRWPQQPLQPLQQQQLNQAGPLQKSRRRLLGRSHHAPIMGLAQARALNFLWTITESIIAAMDELESAVLQAVSEQPDASAAAPTPRAGRMLEPSPFSGPDLQALGEEAPEAQKGKCGGGPPQQQYGCEGLSTASCDQATVQPDAGMAQEGAPAPAEATPVSSPRPGALPDPSATRPAGVVALQLAAGAQQGGGHPRAGWCRWRWSAAAPGRWLPRWTDRWLPGPKWRNWRWSWTLAQLALGVPMLQAIPSIMAANLRLLLTGGPSGRSSLLSSRNAQFGAKYWVATASVLLVVVFLSARSRLEILRLYSPLYAFLATCVSMTDRVESTLSRAALRAAGTVLGGVVGLALLVSPRLQHSPVGIMALVAGAAFLTGCLSANRLVYAAVLTLITMLSMILCQYGTGCCEEPMNAVKLFAARVVSVLLGCTLPVILTQAVLPCFTSDWALETMAHTYLASAALIRQLYRRFFDENLRAHVSSRGLDATVALLQLNGLEEDVERLRGEERQRRQRAEEEHHKQRQEQQQQEQRRHPQPHPPQHLLHRQIELAEAQRQGSLQLAALAAVDPEAASGEQLRAQGLADLEAVGAATEETKAAAETAVADAVVAASGPSPAAGAVGSAGAAGEGSGAGGAVAAAVAAISKALANQAMEVTSQAHVLAPLVAVQTSLMKDVAVWTRGLYGMPLIVPAVLRCCLLLADRLAALQLVVADTPPPVYGRLSGWAFAQLVLPVHRNTMAVLDALDIVVATAARLMEPRRLREPSPALPSYPGFLGRAAIVLRCASCGRDSGSGVSTAPRSAPVGEISKPTAAEAAGPQGQVAPRGAGGAGDHRRRRSAADEDEQLRAELREAINDLNERRLELRQRILDMRRAFHVSVWAADEERVTHAAHSDDLVRFHAMFHAVAKALDKAEATARTVLEYRYSRRANGGRPDGLHGTERNK